MLIGRLLSRLPAVPLLLLATLLFFGQAVKADNHEVAIKDSNTALSKPLPPFQQPRNAGSIEPSNYVDLFKRGLGYMNSGNAYRAERDLSLVLKMKPELIVARLQRAILYLDMGEYVSAFDDIHKVLEAEPENDQALECLEHVEQGQQTWDLVVEARDLGEYHIVIAVLTRLVSISPMSVPIREARAEAYIAIGKPSNATSDLRYVNKLTPGNSEGHYKLAQLFYMLGNFDETLKELRGCLKLDPDNQNCLKMYKKARFVFEKLSSALESQHKRAFLKCVEAAEAVLDREKTENVTVFMAKRLLCSCHLANEEHIKAVKPCRDAIAIKADAHLYCDSGDVYYGLELYDDAKENYEAALKLDENCKCARKGLTLVSNLDHVQMDCSARDYYELLGVSHYASKRQIIKAYRQIVSKWHPDHFRGAEREVAEKKFIEIGKAKEVLTNSKKRKLYDVGIDPNDPEERRCRNPSFFLALLQYIHHLTSGNLLEDSSTQ